MENMKNQNREKKSYLEYIRALATITVVFLHVVMTLPANYSINELGKVNALIFNSCYMFTRWAVPCFFMISGAIMLQPNKQYSISKVSMYIKRMLIVLIFFGTIYGCMELFFAEGKINLFTFLKAIRMVLEGKSWDHLWYIYALIAIYILLIPFKCIVESIKEKELVIMITVLITGNFLIPSINSVLTLEIKDFMILNENITYFVLGYYLATKENNGWKKAFIYILTSTILMLACEFGSIYINNETFVLNHQSQDILTLIQAVGMFLFIKYFYENIEVNNVVNIICKYSFLIYILHPFFINLFYKVFRVTPLSFPIVLGIIILTLGVLIFTFIAAIIVKRVPVLRKYV